MKEYLYGHTSFENAYEVDGYPWGFRLKTKKRYWIETSEKKNGGQRLVHCTLNPKNGRWCKPKTETYSALEFLYLDENGHVKSESISYCGLGCDKKGEKIKNLAETHKEHLTDYQKKELRLLDGYNKAYSKITVSLEPVPFNESEEDKQKRLNERQKAKTDIAKMVKYYTLNSEVA